MNRLDLDIFSAERCAANGGKRAATEPMPGAGSTGQGRRQILACGLDRGWGRLAKKLNEG